MAKNVFRKSIDTMYAGRCKISAGRASYARRRHSASAFISPSLGVLFHHPPRPAPQKTTHVCVLIRPGQMTRMLTRHLPGRTSCRAETVLTRPTLKRKRALILTPRWRRGYPATRSQAVSSSASRTSWAGVQGMRTSGAILRPSVAPIAPAMPTYRLRHPCQDPRRSSSIRDPNLEKIVLPAPSTAKACMMHPVTRF